MKLHEFHARSLESTLILADESMLHMERLLRENGQAGIIRRVESSLSPEKQQLLLREVAKLRRMLADFAADFSLEPHLLDVRRVILAELSSLWVHLQDSRPDRMTGYGKIFDEEASQRLLATVEKLLDQVMAMQALLNE